MKVDLDIFNTDEFNDCQRKKLVNWYKFITKYRPMKKFKNWLQTKSSPHYKRECIYYRKETPSKGNP